jgi:translation initiation factor IF-2
MRGANVTDIVMLVVAADDGIMPQTIEAINHTKAAGVPMIVAITKSTSPAPTRRRSANACCEHEVVVEEMSGDVQDVEVSAKTGRARRADREDPAPGRTA